MNIFQVKNNDSTSAFLIGAGERGLEYGNGANLLETEMVTSWFKLFFGNARDIILLIRRDGRIVEANDSAVKAYGYGRDKLLLMSIYDLRARETLPLVESQMEQAGRNGILFETIHQRVDGCTFHVEVSSQGIMIGEEYALLSIIRDITARKRIRDNPPGTNAQLEASYGKKTAKEGRKEKIKDEAAATAKITKRESGLNKKAVAQGKGLLEIVIASEEMKALFKQAKKYHQDRSIPVLIQGETGTGKEVIAQYIHYGDFNVAEPFIDVNCAALTASLFESELFGYESGSFTGGLPMGQKGKLDLASGGTIFFDEITELPIELQAKLLRVIQEKEFYRVGGLRKIRTNIRIICATNENINKKASEGLFRKDLYYRLNVGHLSLPPLRERKEEILPLVTKFLIDFSKKREKKFVKISDSAARLLLSYNWPGNIRELRNVMEWVTLMYDESVLEPAHLGILQQKDNVSQGVDGYIPAVNPDNFTLPAEGLDLERFINNIVSQALEIHKGNKTKAARYLGISRRSLQCRVERINKVLYNK
ncbi:formate hydrogenlyase transcriptional activator [Desulfocucumis palustris]|uniref:Formate hydrogenlyase transcriptional activator n=1 Tax=Desulfocucumis palustris TaxID=1898651 RepID=A0A2L2XBC3_9FIRM|nr:sigma 54-interacting transcriptional regulator [Desulfocucumis palustris]GBF33597.1 formate hydrogenlyase transcriptional activator [Desulfocucumis palustris]